MDSLNLSGVERETLGEALLVYIFRALDKPRKVSYFHTRLIDVLIKSAKFSYPISKAISWANGTSYIQQFDSGCSLDEHPYAPPAAVSDVFSGRGNYVLLSLAAIERIRRMPREKKRQLEALAATLFPDWEAIRGSGEHFTKAEVAREEEGYLTAPEKRVVKRSDLEPSISKAAPAVDALSKRLDVVFNDPALTPAERESLADEIEDILIGRLELSQPHINVELILRVLKRSMTRVVEAFGSTLRDNVVQNAIASIATIAPVLKAAV